MVAAAAAAAVAQVDATGLYTNLSSLDVVSGGVGDEAWAILADSNSRRSIVLEHVVVGPEAHLRACQAKACSW